MKYFTKAWREGELSDAEFEKIRLSYWQHINQLIPQLPAPVMELATRVSVHDRLIRRVKVNIVQRLLGIELSCGDRQVGYFDLDLNYSDVVVSRDVVETLKIVATDTTIRILYDEIDLSGSGYVHRLAFSPYGEVDIVFGQLSLAMRSCPDRSFGAVEERYFENL